MLCSLGYKVFWNSPLDGAVDTLRKNVTPDIPIKSQHTIDSFNNDLNTLVSDIKAKKEIIDVSALIKEIIENDGFKIPDENIAKLNNVVNNPKFDNLSAEDKKVVMMATLLQDSKNIASQTDTVFDVYNVVSKLGMTRQDADKLLNITKAGSFVTDFMNTNKSEKLVVTVTRGDHVLIQERKDLFTECAWDLKDGNNFELAKMIYQAGEPDGLTRNMDKMMEKEIDRLREKQLLLPQTTQSEILAHTKMMTINGVEVPVVKASEVPGFRTFTHSVGGTTNHQNFNSAIQNLEVFGSFGDEHNVCTCYIGGDNRTIYGLDGYAFMMDVDPNKILVGYTQDINSHAKTKSQAIAEFHRVSEKFMYADSIPATITKSMGISKDEYTRRINDLKQKCGADFSIENMKKYDKEMAEALENGLLWDPSHYSERNTKEMFYSSVHKQNEYDVYNPLIKGIVTTNPPHVDINALKYAKEHKLPIVLMDDVNFDYVKETVTNLNMDNLSSVNIEELRAKIDQLEMPYCDICARQLNDKLAKLNSTITVEQAKLQCNDDKLIELATKKDGSVDKSALDTSMKFDTINSNNKSIMTDYDILQKEINKISDSEIRLKLQAELNNKIEKVSGISASEIKKYAKTIKSLNLKLADGKFLPPENYVNYVYDVMDSGTITRSFGYNRAQNFVLTPADLENINTMLDGAKQYIDIDAIQPERILLQYQILNGTPMYGSAFDRLENMTPEKWATVLMPATKPFMSVDMADAVHFYKVFSDDVQKASVALNSPVKSTNHPDVYLKYAKDLEDFISTMEIPATIEVVRSEGFSGGRTMGCLNTVVLSDGTNLAEAMSIAIEKAKQKDMSYVQALENEINSGNTNYVATNDRFMSTSIVPSQNGGSGDAMPDGCGWTIELPKGSKALFIESCNTGAPSIHEIELLLQRNNKIQIKRIEYNPDVNGWAVVAKVEIAD